MTDACSALCQACQHMRLWRSAQVVQAFHSDSALRDFREWVMTPDEAELAEAAVSPGQRRKGKKRKQAANAEAGMLPLGGCRVALGFPVQNTDSGTLRTGEDEEEGGDGDAGKDGLVARFKRLHRRMRKNWDLPERFPDARVIRAYREVLQVSSLQMG